MDCTLSKYDELLEHSLEQTRACMDGPATRLQYLAAYIFDFTTYDDDMDELFARHAVDVCEAINDKTTFEFIEDEERYKWYLVMCNMPFFKHRIDWGTSIRGAWWATYNASTLLVNSCGLWDGEEQMDALRVPKEEWESFIAALVAFGRKDKWDRRVRDAQGSTETAA